MSLIYFGQERTNLADGTFRLTETANCTWLDWPHIVRLISYSWKDSWSSQDLHLFLACWRLSWGLPKEQCPPQIPLLNDESNNNLHQKISFHTSLGNSFLVQHSLRRFDMIRPQLRPRATIGSKSLPRLDCSAPRSAFCFVPGCHDWSRNSRYLQVGSPGFIWFIWFHHVSSWEFSMISMFYMGHRLTQGHRAFWGIWGHFLRWNPWPSYAQLSGRKT